MISSLLMFVGGVIVALVIVAVISFVFMAFSGGLSVYNENVALRLDKLERKNVELLRMVNEARDYSDSWAAELNNKLNFIKADVELMKEDE